MSVVPYIEFLVFSIFFSLFLQLFFDYSFKKQTPKIDSEGGWIMITSFLSLNIPLAFLLIFEIFFLKIEQYWNLISFIVFFIIPTFAITYYIVKYKKYKSFFSVYFEVIAYMILSVLLIIIFLFLAGFLFIAFGAALAIISNYFWF